MLDEYWQTSTSNQEGKIAPQAAIAAHLPDFSVLTFTGKDVISFLQGYLTVDLTRLDAGSTSLSALTNLKGRVVACGWCQSSDAETLHWIIHASLADPVIAFMKPYLAFARTEVSLRADDHLIIGLATHRQPPTVRVIDNPAMLDEVLAGHAPVAAAEWQRACIEAGLVVVTESTSGRFLPQMLGLVELGAIDFDKGCYLGQEVVARAQHRGQVKRGLVRLEGSRPVSATEPGLLPGAILSDATGRNVGTLVATAITTKPVDSAQSDTTGTVTEIDCLAVAGQSLPATLYLDEMELDEIELRRPTKQVNSD